LRYSLLEAFGELRGVYPFVLCLAFKRWPDVVELELVDNEQLVEVEEIACLEAAQAGTAITRWGKLAAGSRPTEPPSALPYDAHVGIRDTRRVASPGSMSL